MDQELLERLGVFYSEVQVAEIVKEMEDAAVVRMCGEFEMPPVDEMGVPLTPVEELALAQQQAVRRVEGIHSRFTRRMHLSEFMKSLLERSPSGSTACIRARARCGKISSFA